MNDTEIIKALECCSWKDEKHCEICPYEKKETNTYCSVDLAKDALDLINRQKAEIEKKDIEIDILIRKKGTLRDEISELRAEVERLKAKDNRWAVSYANAIAKVVNAKSEVIEAISEFNAYKTGIFIKGEELMIIPMSDYDEILKEMVGDDNG